SLFVIVLVFVQKRYRAMAMTCFLGAIFPDLVDLGPAILNKQLGWHLPVLKIFPWHWPQYSGSIYDGSRWLTSLLGHILVTTASLGLLYLWRKNFFGGYQRQ